MTNEEFNAYMKKRFDEILQLREQKAKEYTKDNAFENFISASKFLEESPEKVAFFYVTKHIISIKDALFKGVGEDKLREKVSDIIVYMLLIEAMALTKGADKKIPQNEDKPKAFMAL